MKRLVIMFAALMLALGVATVAEAASCTGKCWMHVSGAPKCGFTAMTEGSRCRSGVTWNGFAFVAYCEEYACDGGEGFEPENQGELGTENDLLLCESGATGPLNAHAGPSVQVLEPRT